MPPYTDANIRYPRRRVTVILSLICLLAVLSSIFSPLFTAKVYAQPAMAMSAAQQAKAVEDAIKAIADQPLTNAPLQLRRTAYTTLTPLAGEGSSGRPDVLPRALVEQLNQDNETAFFDAGRITSGDVLAHDWDLIQQLIRILRNRSIAAADKQVYLNGLVLVLRASRHIAELAVQDAKVVLAGAEAAGSLSAEDLNQARDYLQTAEQRLQNGLTALRAGDADRAAHHFEKAWTFSARVLALWNLRYDGDNDQDGIIDIVEFRLGTSPFSGDTDKDSLSDHDELHTLIPHTLPTSADTDQDGTTDAAEDTDEDGLNNGSELAAGTDPLIPDSDDDTLLDGAEINDFGSDPLKRDSDDDGLSDDSEQRLGTDPRNSDTDQDTILDGQDSYFQTISKPELGVTVELLGIGDHSSALHIHSLADSSGLKGTLGLVGDFVEIETDQPIISATVRMRYDPALVPHGDVTGLRLFHYDEQEAQLEELPNQYVDIAAHEVRADTSEFSPFGIVYKPKHEEPREEKAIRAGFDAITYGANDDGSYPCVSDSDGTPPGCSPQRVPLGFSINFFGTIYDSLYINTNGNITFDEPLSTFTPFDLTTTERVIIAPFFSDVDTRVGNPVVFGQNTVDGRPAFGVTWPGVGCYDRNTPGLNYFQVILIDRSDIAPGDFDIEFNINSIQWETGEASGGNSSCQGGAAARVGYSNGSGNPGTFFELEGSGLAGSFLDSNTTTGLIHHNLNSSQLGRYIFPVRAGAPVPDQDSDFDGLTDVQETSGFRTQFGSLVYTNPLEADTDADGIIDSEEVTGGPDTFTIYTDPTLEDTDSDGISDFIELRELPDPTDPLDPDTDNDGLSDGTEVYTYSTDPLGADTDGDGVSDTDELNEGADPLQPTTRSSTLDTISEFFIGAICGEFCIDDHDNLAFFAGLLITGAISAIPTPITVVIGLIADIRDFLAALVKGDWANLAILGAALLPWIGDAADLTSTVVRFLLRHPHLAAEVAIFLVRMDWIWNLLTDANRAKILRTAWGSEVIDGFIRMGFTLSKMEQLANAGANLRHVYNALQPVFDNFPGLPFYIRQIPIDHTGVLRGNGLAANLVGLSAAQAAGNQRAVRAYLSNIKGAYTQFQVMPAERMPDIRNVIDRANTLTAPGYDIVAEMKTGKVRLLEAKASDALTRRTLSHKDLEKYVWFGPGGLLYFNKAYFKQQSAYNNSSVAYSAFNTGNLEIEFFINGPNSATIRQNLINQLGGTVAIYLDDFNIMRQVNIIITAVSR